MGWVKTILALAPALLELLNNVFKMFKKSTQVQVDKKKDKVLDKINKDIDRARNRK